MIYVAFPNKLNSLMERVDMNPMKEIKITRDFVDELVSQLDEITNLLQKTA